MSFNIASFPNSSKNPYLRLFYEALEAYGAQLVEGFVLSPRWLFRKHTEIDAIHFHWPEWLWDGRYEGEHRALLKLQAFLSLAGLLRIKRIWTVHNLDPHEGEMWADRWGQRLLARYCDLLIVHSQITKEQVRHKLSPKAPIIVMPHGSYEGHYPEPRSQSEILKEFGLEEGRPVLCCLGRLREYKGLDLACEALTLLGEEVRLVIAGTPHQGFDITSLEHYAKILPNLKLIARTLSDQEFVDLLSVADMALLPYRQITGSGALLASWTQGCGVVASDLDFFREMLPNGSEAGRLFQAGNAEALAGAIREYLTVPLDKRRKAAHALAASLSWERCVEPVGAVIQSWQGGRTKNVDQNEPQAVLSNG